MKKVLFSLSICFLSFGLLAQSAHFSQFFSVPTNLNPALTGVHTAKLRLASNFRNQWGNLSTPYRTYNLAADYKITNPGLKRDFMGAGISFYNDVSGGAAKLRNSRIAMSTSFGKNFSKKKMTNILVVGFQAGLNLMSIDYTKLQFGSQFVNDNFDETAASGETPLLRNQFSYDYSAGGFFVNETRDGIQTTIGASYYHFNQPNQTLSRSGEDKMSARLNVHGSFQFKFGETMKLMPIFVFSKQGTMSEFTSGMLLNFADMNRKTNTEKSAFYAGGMIRSKDAFIVLIGGTMKGVKMGISYDINLSQLSAGTNFAGGPELYLQYLLDFGKRGGRVTIPSLRI